MSNIDRDSLDRILREACTEACKRNSGFREHKGLRGVFLRRLRELHEIIEAIEKAPSNVEKDLYKERAKNILTTTYDDTKKNKQPVNLFFYADKEICCRYPEAVKCYDNFLGVATVYEGITLLTYNIYEVFMDFIDSWELRADKRMQHEILCGIIADLFFPNDKDFFMSMSKEHQEQYMKNLFGTGRYPTWSGSWRREPYINKYHIDIIGTGIAPMVDLSLIIEVKGEVEDAQLPSEYSLLSNLNFQDVLKLSDSRLRNMLWNGVNMDLASKYVTLIKDDISADGIHTKVYVSYSSAEKFYLIHVYNVGFSHIFELNQL